ncbi:MAG: hypothetical protein A2083_02395 [Gemmatimonadetes bacterium GWC2_71_9]|nr:MAG: hypothetical protein A3I79_08790 [Gemmatimonadetes bacterium RIFCSPLOWO2_02_FULL_71_11]OGT95457.1 MAG: hypothetical protein A2083_02395 [Gemmatimonadetes bacterium GWC2_71_9]
MLARLAIAAVPLALAAPAARSQAPRDTLLYNVAIHPRDPHLTVEARLTTSAPGTVVLAAPPSAAPAGTSVAGLSATDDRGTPLPVRRSGATFAIDRAAPPAVRFRYRLDFERRVAEGSTGSALDTSRLYAVTRSVFVAPDPTAFRKTSRTYPVVRVVFLPPPGWTVVAGWPLDGGVFQPADGSDLVGATVAAAPDFRLYRDTVAGGTRLLAIRGHRYFSDSALAAVIDAGLRKGAAALGPVPVARVTYTSELGRKGRTSGSLQGLASIGLIWEPSELLELARSHDTFHETLHLWFGGAVETERWWTEGVTDYLAARLLAEWKGRPEDLAALTWESYRNYLAIDHNTRMTMAEENRASVGGDNTELLVYRKGMLAGLLLDAAIRRETQGRTTLDAAAARLLAVAATRRSRAVREAEIRDAVVDAGGAAAARAWSRVVDGADLLGESEIRDALLEVTGRAFDPPRALKRRKTLRNASDQRDGP